MEYLTCFVDRICYKVFLRMPCRIDTCRKDGIGLEIYLFSTIAINIHCSAIVLTNMKLRVSLAIIILCHMAVYTLSIVTLSLHTIAIYYALVEVGYIALIYRHTFIIDIRRFYQTISQKLITWFHSNRINNSRKMLPFITFLYIYIGQQISALSFVKKAMPIINIDIQVGTRNHNFFFSLVAMNSHHNLITFIKYTKIERRNIWRQHCSSIIRIDTWHTCYLFCVLRNSR